MVTPDFEFTHAVLNAAWRICTNASESQNGIHSIKSPRYHNSNLHSFEDDAEELGVYKANADAIMDVIRAAVKNKLLPPAEVLNREWDLCRNLGYLSCDCVTSCTGKFQTVLDEFVISSSITPPHSATNLTRASSEPQRIGMQSARGDRRKSLSHADILKKQLNLYQLREGKKSLGAKSFFLKSAKHLPVVRQESITSEAEDWEDEDVMTADGDEFMDMLGEGDSNHSSPKKRRMSTTTVRLALPATKYTCSKNAAADVGEDVDEDNDDEEEFEFRFRCHGVVAEARGPPPYMEDRHICLNEDPLMVYKQGVQLGQLLQPQHVPFEAIYAVIDGHGGSLVAENLFVDFPRLLIRHPLYKTDLEEAIRSTCDTIDRRYVQQTLLKTSDKSGAVATFMVVRDEELICANVGDCRSVLSRGGRAENLTKDHTLDNKEELERVKRSNVQISKNRIYGDLAVARSFGDARHKPRSCQLLAPDEDLEAAKLVDAIIATPEITRKELLQQDEFVIMASDGLWDVFSSQAAVDYVRGLFTEFRSKELTVTLADVSTVAAKLVKAAQRKGSRDNITVCIACLWCRTLCGDASSSELDDSETLTDDDIDAALNDIDIV